LDVKQANVVAQKYLGHLMEDRSLRGVRLEEVELTDDFRLAGQLEHQGIAVMNFNHIRAASWFQGP
jgi:hypothetical protein